MPWKIKFALKFFTALKYFYLSGFLRKLRLPWKQSLSWNFSLCLIYFLHSGCLSKFCLLWETECAPNQLYWMYFLSFRILNNLRLPWKTEFALKIFTALTIAFTYRIFEQLDLALKTEFALNFSSRGGGRPPLRTPLPLASIASKQTIVCSAAVRILVLKTPIFQLP